MFGVDYYPEHWNKNRIEIDMKSMVNNGVKIIRVAEIGRAHV